MKNQRRKSPVWLVAAMGVATLTASLALACSTPVFRYALERWEPDAYEVIVCTHGSLAPAEGALVERLTKAAGEKSPLNVAVKTVDLDATPDAALSEAIKTGDGKQPWLVMRYPSHTPDKRLAYAIALDEASVNAVLDSPARREVGKRLMSGDSIVWVFLETGTDADETAVAQLNKTLAQMEKEIATIAPSTADSPGGPDQVADLSKVKVHFSLLRIKKDDAGELVFRQILMHSEDELDPAKPIVFPLFGRGRALYAIAGRGINESNIAAAVTFLTGACSCEVKAQNPGVDVPMAVDWKLPADQLVVPGGGEPELTSITSLAAEDAATTAPTNQAPTSGGSVAPVSPGGGVAGAPAPTQVSFIGLFILVVIAGVIVLAISSVLSRGSKDGGGAS